jgi:hypothetical protein
VQIIAWSLQAVRAAYSGSIGLIAGGFGEGSSNRVVGKRVWSLRDVRAPYSSSMGLVAG